MNLLSIGAAYGVLVVIFQWGWGADLIGIDTGPIEAIVPADDVRHHLRALDGLRSLPALTDP